MSCFSRRCGLAYGIGARGLLGGRIMRKRPICNVVAVVALLALCSVALGQSPISVNIATVLANPNNYINVRREPGNTVIFTNDLQISIKGTVQEPQVNEQFYGVTQKMVCSQRFILVDDTGSMPAYNNFFCDVADRQSITLAPGGRVIVTGWLDWTGRDAKGKFLGLILHVTNIMRP